MKKTILVYRTGVQELITMTERGPWLTYKGRRFGFAVAWLNGYRFYYEV